MGQRRASATSPSDNLHGHYIRPHNLQPRCRALYGTVRYSITVTFACAVCWRYPIHRYNRPLRLVTLARAVLPRCRYIRQRDSFSRIAVVLFGRYRAAITLTRTVFNRVAVTLARAVFNRVAVTFAGAVDYRVHYTDAQSSTALPLFIRRSRLPRGHYMTRTIFNRVAVTFAGAVFNCVRYIRLHSRLPRSHYTDPHNLQPRCRTFAGAVFGCVAVTFACTVDYRVAVTFASAVFNRIAVTFACTVDYRVAIH